MTHAKKEFPVKSDFWNHYKSADWLIDTCILHPFGEGFSVTAAWDQRVIQSFGYISRNTLL